MKMSALVVGYAPQNYISERNVIDILPDARYARARDIYRLRKVAATALNRAAGREVFLTLDLINQFHDFGINSVNLLHFVNAVSYGKTPWLTTFETIMPRLRSTLKTLSALEDSPLDPRILRSVKAIAGQACKRCIAMSNCAANLQKHFLEHFPVYQSAIEQKLTVLHPPQALLIERYEDKSVSITGALKFMLVGAAFFRKGGVEVIETLERLRREFGYDIELTIVSSLSLDPYATQETIADVHRAQQFIDHHRAWIRHYPKLDNQRVLELMKQAHVGLLPTYAETYGFSVLELQAAGCPVITTDVRALPEVNHADWGWVISVPKTALGEAIYATATDRQTISQSIRQGLEQIVHELFRDRTIVARKAGAAIAHIQSNHSPTTYAEQLRHLYLQALAH